MATAEPNLLDELNKNSLICAICSERYRNARILPCLHSFCEQCIGKLTEKAGGKTVLCPTCRRGHDLPDGLASIPKNLFLNELAGLIEKERGGDSTKGSQMWQLPESSTPDLVSGLCSWTMCRLHNHRLMSLETYNNTRATDPAKVQPPVYCSSHPDNQVKFYCDTCDIPICLECTALDHKLTEHNYRYLNDAASEYKKYLVQMVDTLQEKELQANVSKEEVKKTSESLKRQFQNEEKKLNEHIEKTIKEITAKIRENGNHLMVEMKREYESRKQNFQAQIKELEIAENDMKHARDFGKKLMHYGNDAQMMSAKKGMTSQIRQLIEVNTKQHPVEEEYVEFQRSDFHETKSLGVVLYHICNFKITNVPKYARINEEINVSMTTSGNQSRPLAVKEIRAELSSPSEKVQEVKVVENQDRTISLKCHCSVEGKHELSVSVWDKPIGGSLAQITIIPNKGVIWKYGITGLGMGQFSNVWGVCVDGNGVTAVCHQGVQLFSLYGTHQRVLQFTNFTSRFDPRHVAISKEGYYFITDNRNKQVVVFDKNSKVIRCFGNQELTSPMGIAISPVNDRVYVSDCSAHCIRIYTQDGEYVKSFGSQGNGQCQFYHPWGMTIDNKGNVIVAEYNNHRIQVCNSDGVFLFSFGSQGSANNQFNGLWDVACDNDGNMYVCDHNNRVMKYDSHGVFVSRIDSDQDALQYPTGISVTGDKPFGYVVVADRGSHCIKVFAQ
ncbi:tripartite motif-containing protein 2-like [Saccoglossus kowalevskii]